MPFPVVSWGSDHNFLENLHRRQYDAHGKHSRLSHLDDIPRSSPRISIAEAETILVVLQADYRFDFNGTLSWYGESPNHERTELAASSPRACGTDDVHYATNHLASEYTCQTLMDTLRTDGASGVPESPRAICLDMGFGQCCISWSKPVPGLVYNNLYSAAEAVRDGCFGLSNRISGYAENTSLNGVCLHQCFSNQPGGC